jgi:hypothetical protein
LIRSIIKFKIKKKLGIFRENLKLFYNFTDNKFGSKGYCVKLFNLNHECSNLNLQEFSNLEVYFLFYFK